MTGTANGTAVHAPPVPFVPLVPRGPVVPWPRTAIPQPPPSARLLPLATVPRHDPAPAATPVPRDPWYTRLQAVDGGSLVRLTAGLAVLGVAAIAAVVSYSHIFDLAVAHHESGTAARLLPVSVDGLIVSASMTLLDAARRRLDAPFMAYLMLSFGVGATVAANVAFGLPWGWQSAVVAAWPAVAFVGSVEMALTMARNQRKAADGRDGGRSWRFWRRRKTTASGDDMADEQAAAPAATPAATAPPPAAGTPPAPAPAKVPARTAKRPPLTAKAAKADAAIAANPGKTNAEIAKLAGVSERTVERQREAARKAAQP